MILSFSFWELHIVGGQVYMFPLLILLVVNIFLILFVSVNFLLKKQINVTWLEAIKQIGSLAAAWGTWSTLFGLFQAFNAIEMEPQTIPLQVISGGMKVALITILYGLIIFCVSLLAYIVLKITLNTSNNLSHTQ